MKTLDFLRARTEIQSRIKRLESEIETLKSELDAFDRVEMAMRRLSLSSEPEQPDLTLAPPALEPQAANSFEDVKEAAREILRRGHYTRSALDIVASSSKPLTAREVGDEMLAKGIRPNTKNFPIMIVKILNRLVGQGLIKKEKQDGRVTFASK